MAHYSTTVCEVSYDTDWYNDNYYTPYRISFLLPRTGTFDYRTVNVSQGDGPNVHYLPSFSYYEYLHSQYDIRSAACTHQASRYAESGNNLFLKDVSRSKTWHGPLKSATQNDSRSVPTMRRELAWSGFHGDEEDPTDDQLDQSQEKLEWSDALNKWISENKLQARPYMTFIGNPPVIEKVISSMKENNEKRDAVRKRSEEHAMERKARKAYSSPLYTSMAERKQKARMQSSRLPQSTPVSPDPRKKQTTVTPVHQVWDKPKETVEIQEKPPEKLKREISIKPNSPKLEEEPSTPLIPVRSSDQDTPDRKSVESKRVTFKHSDDEDSPSSRASTPSSKESKKEDELNGDLEQLPKQDTPPKVQQPTQPDTLQPSTAKSLPDLSYSSKLGKTPQLPETVPNKTVSEPSKRQKGMGDNFRSSSQQTRKSVVPLLPPKLELKPKKKASKPAFKENKGVFKPKRQVAEVRPSSPSPSLPISKQGGKKQRITKKMFKPLHERRRVVEPSIVRLCEDTEDALGISPTKIPSWIYEDEESNQRTSPEVEGAAETKPEEVEQKTFNELLANLNPALIEKTDQEQIKQIRKASHARFMQASLHTTTYLRKPSKDRSYEDELRRSELAEERRKRQHDMLEKLRSKRTMLQEEEDANMSPHFEDYGFLSKYCIFSKGHMEMYRHAFDAVDDEGKGWLSGPDVMIALRGVNSKLTEAEEEYLYRILELTGYKIANGADFKLFSVLAALSQRITALDSWMKNIIGTMDFKTLEMKMFMCKTLWECNVDHDVNKISIDQLCVELRAGGVSKDHEMEVREKLGHIEALDLLDFLTYIPLFIMIHQSVISNPLDDSREK